MIDFLKECNINDNTIKELETRYNKELLYCLYCNEYQIKDIINYFNSIGIECIDDILINYPGIFTETLTEIKKMFSFEDTSSLVKLINNDYTIIEKIS